MRARETGFADIVVATDEPVAASVPGAPLAVIELEIVGKVRLPFPLTTPPTLAASDGEGAGRLMIPVLSQVRIWLAVGRTDMRRGMQGLVLQVRRRWAGIRMPAIFMSSVAAAPGTPTLLARLPAYRIDDLLPWNCRPAKLRAQPAAA
ncbi:hypothetical protein NKJ64_22235 [Mesorhizobium sp. M0062]|uniref:hypothetical protein n=1 Tax=Mesorhizobium sp. M0062 TaxID=2956867 RepID=UPI00333DAB6C